VTTHVFDLKLELLLCSVAGALFHHQTSLLPSMFLDMYAYLESKMLQEVCGSIGLVRFRPTSSIDPNTDGRSLSPRRVLSGNLKVHLSQLIS
jgi:hypothetical protein